VQELVAGVFAVEVGEAIVHSSPAVVRGREGGKARPGGDLVGGVVDVRDGRALSRDESAAEKEWPGRAPGCSSSRWRPTQFCGCGRLKRGWVSRQFQKKAADQGRGSQDGQPRGRFLGGVRPAWGGEGGRGTSIENFVGDEVEVIDVSGEPRDLFFVEDQSVPARGESEGRGEAAGLTGISF
jgi:hypothetical protein